MKRPSVAEIVTRIVVVIGQVMAALGMASVAILQPALPAPIASLQPLVGLPERVHAAIGGLSIITSGCYPSGGLSKSTVQVEVPYSGLVAGDRITVTLTTGTTTYTQTFTPESPTYHPLLSPVVAAFEIDANNAPYTVTVRDSKGGLQTGTGNAPPPCPTLVCNAGNLGGKAFNDYNSDGRLNALETTGVSGIRVDVYDRLGNTYTTTTDVDGLYAFTSIPAGNYPVRMEFSNVPAVYGQGTALGTNNGGSVQFINAPICTAHYALLNPADYSEPNPTVAIPRYNRGDPLAVGVKPSFAWSAIVNNGITTSQPYQTSMFPAVVMYSSTLNTTNAYDAGITRTVPAGQVGSLWGAAWSKQRSNLYLSSVLRRYTGYGPLGPGGIYQWNRTTNTTSPLVDVRSLGIDVGIIASNAARGLTATNVTWLAGAQSHMFQSDNVEAEVGQVGLGDLEISDDGNVLFFTNLHQRTLHSYDLQTGAAATYTLPYSDTSPLPAATCTDGIARPWATKVKDGKVYVGVVCDASLNPGLSASQGYSATATDLFAAKSDLRAKVFAMDIATGVFEPAPIFDFPLTYPKGAPAASAHVPVEFGWWPWTDRVPILARTSSFYNYSGYGVADAYIWPEPIFMDIEFDVDGSMVMAFGDRGAMQMGWWDYLSQPNPETNRQLHIVFVGGDLLRAYRRGDTFVLENNGKAGPNTGCCANNSQGPGYGEFYNEDFLGHQEVMAGGLALRPGSGEVIGVVMDPNTAQATGTRTWNNTNGANVRSVRAVNSDNYPRMEYDPASFGKAGGMGDIELLSDIPRYQEAGTRLWEDIDGDGIQDPDEPGRAGVQVVLYDLAGNAVATSTTDANGVVVFMSNTDPRLSSSGIYSNSANIPTNTKVITGLIPGAQYQLRVPLNQPALANTQTSPANSTGTSAVPTAIDSDGVRINSNGTPSGGFSVANFTWPSPGNVEQTVDFGFIPPRAALQILKAVTGGPSVSDAFTVTLTGPNQFLTTTTIALGVTRTITNLLPGFYTVQETLPPPPAAPPGYTWSGNLYAPSNGEITLLADVTGTVHVTNTLLPQPPSSGLLTVTKMVSWFNVPVPVSQTFQITISGPSFPTGQPFTIVSGSLGITNLIPGTYIVTETLPGNGWGTTYTVHSLQTTTNAVITLTNDLTSTLTAGGNISGRVYDDLNMNGAADVGETGVPSVTVRAYDRDGVLRGTATTDASGNYTLAAAGNGPYRVEFTNLPQGYQPSIGYSAGDVSVQEVAGGGVSGVDFAVAIPALYCQNNPDIAAALCNNGAASGNAGAALVSFPSSASGTSGTNVTAALASQIGTVWGTAYQRSQQYVYAAASVQRHKGLGARGEDGIYVIDYSSGMPSVAGGFDLSGITPQNGGSAINLGSVNRSIAANGLAASNYTLGAANTASIDLDAYAKVGKTGYGGLAIDEGGNGANLWAVNLNQNTLLKVDVSGGLGSLPGMVRAYDLADIAGYPTCDMATPQGALTQRINVGGTAFTDSGGRSWVADTPFVFGGTSESSATAVTNLNNLYEGTRDLGMYQSRRVGAMTTAISLTNGTYQVILHFAELTAGSVQGSRQFNISAEGAVLSTDYDVFLASPGGVGRATTYQFKLNLIDGVLNLALANGTDGDSPMLSGIEVIPVTGQSGTLRPWAVTMHGGLGYIGAVCDASNSLNPADLRAYVLSFNPSNPSLGLTTVISFGLNYNREAQMGGALSSRWSAWRTVATEFGWAGEANYRPGAAQPMLTNIAFTKNGSLALGFADRAAMQRAQGNFTPFASSSIVSNEPLPAGDVIQVCNTASGYALEGQAGCADADPGTGGSAADGPSNSGEFYFDDGYSTGLGAPMAETSLGGLAYLPGADELVNSAHDPVNNVAENERVGHGVQFFNAQTGARTDEYRLRAGLGFPFPTLASGDFMGASNAMGDLEPLCAAAPIEIGNWVWYDQNGNGRQDPGEPGLGGVTVQLAGPTGISTTTTNGAGYFVFQNLRASTQYTLTVNTAQGSLATYQATQANISAISGSAISNDPVLDVRDSDALLVGNDATIYYKTGNAGVSNHGLDFGFTRPPLGEVGILNVSPAQVTVGDRLWFDVNNDGLDNDGAGTGIPGVAVELYQDTNGDGVFTPGMDVLISATTTSAAGYYSFTAVAQTSSPTTTYMVVITSSNFISGPLAGYRNSDGNGASAPDVDTNTATDDDNGDEIGTAGSSNFVVATKPFTLTAGSAPTDEGNPIGSVQPDQDTNATPSFGFYRLQVGNQVWNDLDNDGVKDASEPGLSGVTMRLLDSGGNVINTTTTNASGLYTFTSLVSGTYSIEVVPTGNFTSSTGAGEEADPDSNGDSNDNGVTLVGGAWRSAPFDLIHGDTGALGNTNVMTTTGTTANPTIDFGLWEPLGIGDRVWEDYDHDGVQDPGEPGIPGVLVTLQTPTGTMTTTTNASGIYTFTNLIGGTYVATFTAPSAYTGTLQNSLNPNDGVNTDSNANPIAGVTPPFNLAVGANPSVDAGFWRPAALGNQVWEDLDHDGVQDAGERGISGALVTLRTPTGTVTTTTDASGNYTFTNLISGTHFVTFTAPSGYTGTLANVGSDVTDSDGNALTGGTGPITVNAGDAITNVDAGFWRPARLGNLVWEDYDHDGQQDPGEPGIPGVQVTLQTPTGTLATTTDANGLYTFTNLISGTYAVTFTAPSGYTGTLANLGSDATDSDGNPLTGSTGPITVNAGDAITNVDAGFWRPATIGDLVWEDLNHNGLQDFDEPGIAGVLVTLQTPAGTITTTTDANGNYTFTNLVSGTFPITFTAPNAYTFTQQGSTDPNDNIGFDSNVDALSGFGGVVSVGPADVNTTVDAGLWRPASLGDRVWEDWDHDGVQDAGEPGIPDVLVTLHTPEGTFTTTTDASGNYTFTNLISGTYQATFATPAGYIGTLQNAGGDATDSDSNPLTGDTGPITVNAGDTITHVDAGFWRPATLGNFVWEDYDHDGVQDAGEPGIRDVVVTLQTPTGTVTTTTDASGLYTFTNLISGTYFVTFTAPSGYTGTLQNMGSAATDSDGNPLTGGTGPIVINAGDAITDVDAGFWRPATLGNFVWEDYDHDGVQDVGEPGIPGVLVTLQTPTGTITTTTSASGNYSFTNLISGTHFVTFTAPSGYTGTLQNIGSDLKDSDANSMTGATGPINVKAGDNLTTLDTGYVDSGLWRPASLGDRVWEDLDHDGVQDAGEPGISDVLVTLQTPTGTITTTTDANGNYAFTNLISGTHYVTFTAPSGYTGTLANVGSDATDSDGNPITGGTGPITLNAGDAITNVDAGFWRPATLGNFVWEDLDHDGVQDAGEPGIAGVLVTLQTPTGTLTTTTDASGNYTFTNLISATYALTFSTPSGYTGTTSAGGVNVTDNSDADAVTGNVSGIVLNAGETNPNVDAGFWRPATLGDRVWEDLDHDGVQDAGEPGIPGVQVILQTPTGTLTTLTDANGNYTFTNLISGTHAVTFTAPAGYIGTLQNMGSAATDSDGNPLTGGTGPIKVNAGDAITNVDAGFWRPAMLGNRVWEDYDHDGQQDPGEPGIPGVLVTLQTPTGTLTTTTDAGGLYTFTNLISGTHVATFSVPSGYTGTLQNVGSDLTDSDANPLTGVTGPIAVTPGATLTNVDVGYVDAGFWRPASLGDRVWEDYDHDGVQDAGEPGIPGVTVMLQTPTGTITTTTDVSGLYTFTNLISGTYFVSFTAPSGYMSTLPNVGSDGTDSDANALTGGTGPITVNAGDAITHVDAGFWRPAALGNFVWEDYDHDGVQDAGEPGIPGVLVTLQTPTGTITTTTNASGNYSFTNLISGTHFMTFTAPSGYTGTLQNIGSDLKDSDANPMTGATGPINVKAGDTLTSLDTGYVDSGLWRPASLGDRVWEDLDHDGMQDPGEPGIAGVLVTLQTPTGTITTTTDANGLYTFTNLISGTHFVTFTAPSGYTGTLANVGSETTDSDGNPITGGTGPITVNAGDAITNVDMGFWRPASVGDRVWEDLDHDGVQAAGEPGISGVLVTLKTPTGTLTTATDANGLYTFTNLISGTYAVTFTAPSGYTGTLANVGNDATDSDGNVLTGGTGPIAVNAGDAITHVDAGFWRPASLGDRVWEDWDRDGVQDPDEPGLPGVLVTLQTPVGIVTTTTDASGNYTFTNLISGTHYVTFTAPSGYAGTLSNVGSDAADSDGNPLTGGTGPIKVSAGDAITDVDTGFWRPAMIATSVWEDYDHDGVRDPGEPGIPGILVTLQTPTGTIATTTDANGFYTFTNLISGTHSITFTAPATPHEATVINTGGVLTDTVWQDLDGDGVQDPGEPGLPGIVVTLQTPTGTVTTTTDANGIYTFTNVGDGTHVVDYTTPTPNYSTTLNNPIGTLTDTAWQDLDGDGVRDPNEPSLPGIVVTLQTPTGTITTTTDANGVYTFGNLGGGTHMLTYPRPPINQIDTVISTGSTLTDTVWQDLNGDGVRDPNEPGLPGIVVTLQTPTGTITTTTDASGVYTFTNVAGGTSALTYETPSRYQFTIPNVNGNANDSVDSDTTPIAPGSNVGTTAPFAVTPGVFLNDITAGFWSPITLGDRVWEDLDHDGVQDPGEQGIPGVLVTLQTPTGTVTTTTDASGLYTFTNLISGTYAVIFTAPSGYAGTLQGSANPTDGVNTDSNADPITGGTGSFILMPGQVNLNVDAGFWRPASVGDRVWEDLNHNGVQDLSEPGVPGVTVMLQTPTGTVTTTTDASGNYTFTNLVDASTPYTVSFVPPASYTFTLQTAGSSTADSNPNALTGVSAPITLQPGENNASIDAGLWRPMSLGNQVWFDTNDDGVTDAGELGVVGVTVTLYVDMNGNGVLDAADQLTGTTATDSGGYYTFTSLISNTYFVVISRTNFAPGGALANYQNSEPTVSADSDLNNRNHGVVNGTLGAGGYVASGPITLRPGAEPANDGDADPNTNYSIDFGFYKLEVGNQVFEDLNNNGLYEPGLGETPMPSVTVVLMDALSNTLRVTTTDANGAYTFTNLVSGTYSVRIVRPTGYVSSQDMATSADNVTDNDDNGVLTLLGSIWTTPFQLTPGTEPAIVTATGTTQNPTVDFGIFRPLMLAGRIVDDHNDNGTLASSEAGLPGVIVEVYADTNGDGVPDGPALGTATTDAAGNYTFTNLISGTFVVVITNTNFLPGGALSGWHTSDTTPAPNTDSNVDDDDDGRAIPQLPNAIVSAPINLFPGTEPGTTFTNGDTNSSVDFGFYQLALGDLVWNDANNDGLVSAGEQGVAGVEVRLYRDSDGDGMSDGAPISTTTTSNIGTYRFTGLISDTYLVEIVPPLNYASSTGANGNTSGSYETAPDPDNDVDNDDSGTSVGAVIRSGPVSLSAGSEPATDGDAESNSNLTVDFGIFQPLSLGNLVWKDDNNDGQVNAGEQGIAGITVTLYLSNGVALSNTVTDVSGHYTFTSLIPGDYYVEIVPPAGYVSSSGRLGSLTGPYEQAPSPENNIDNDDNGTQTTQPPGGGAGMVRSQLVMLSLGQEPVNDGDVNPNTNFSVDLGLFRPATIGNLVWDDSNVNGQQDPGETGIVGVQVVLYDAITNAPIATTTTGAGGIYTFTNLIPGDYYLEFAKPAGYSRSLSNQGDDDGDSDVDPATGRTATITLDEGEVNDMVDAGLFQLASIGDRVWHDLNNNGMQDAGEPGVPGVTVTLFYNGVPVSATVTDDTGFYAFAQITPSLPLSIQIVLPNGYVFVQQNVGGNTATSDQTDNDVDPLTGASESVSVQPNAFNRDLDAGIWAPLTLGGQVVNDLNNDGVLSAVESGIGGLVMQLYVDTNDDGVLDSNDLLVSTTTTGADGTYSFTNLVQENYFVVVAAENFAPGGALAGYAGSAFVDNTDANADQLDDGRPAFNGGISSGLIRLEAGAEPSGLLNQENFTVDFGVWQPASLGDFVWFDTNHDGVQDAGETGHNGLIVQLIDVITGQVIATTTTANDSATGQPGYYLFAGLVPGEYAVQFALPGNAGGTAAFVWTTPNAPNDETDSDAGDSGRTGSISLAPGQNERTVDAGYWRPTTFEIVKSVNKKTTVHNGEVLTYTIRIRNTGDTLGTGIVLTDPVPAGTVYVNAWGEPAVAVNESNRVVVWRVGTLAPGADFIGSIAVRVEGVAADATILNVAVMGAASMPGAPVVINSNQVVNPLEPTAVTLSEFNATVAPEGVRLVWRTALERSSFGFTVWRSKTGRRADAMKVNDEIILARGPSAYGLVDADGALNDSYWLQEMELDGRLIDYGPAVARMPSSMPPVLPVQSGAPAPNANGASVIGAPGVAGGVMVQPQTIVGAAASTNAGGADSAGGPAVSEARPAVIAPVQNEVVVQTQSAALATPAPQVQPQTVQSAAEQSAQQPEPAESVQETPMPTQAPSQIQRAAQPATQPDAVVVGANSGMGVARGGQPAPARLLQAQSTMATRPMPTQTNLAWVSLPLWFGMGVLALTGVAGGAAALLFTRRKRARK